LAEIGGSVFNLRAVGWAWVVVGALGSLGSLGGIVYGAFARVGPVGLAGLLVLALVLAAAASFGFDLVRERGTQWMQTGFLAVSSTAMVVGGCFYTVVLADFGVLNFIGQVSQAACALAALLGSYTLATLAVISLRSQK
jgi:hypothetical protein